MPEIEPGSALCRASALPAVLSSGPKCKMSFHPQGQSWSKVTCGTQSPVYPDSDPFSLVRAHAPWCLWPDPPFSLRFGSEEAGPYRGECCWEPPNPTFPYRMETLME